MPIFPKCKGSSPIPLSSSLSSWLCGIRCAVLFRAAIRTSRPFPVSRKRALVFAPHQDDETFGCGGMIALKCRQGTPVAVVFLTDGNRSHIDKPEISLPDLPEIRRREALTALQVLGVTETAITFLSQPDFGLHTLATSEREELLEHLTGLMRGFQPEEVYVPHRHDRHPDHEETFKLAHTALERAGLNPDVWQYPIWLFWWKNWPFLQVKGRDMAHAYRLPLGLVHERKKRAIAAYQSQMPILPPGFLERFLSSQEVFFKVMSAAHAVEDEKASTGRNGVDKT